MQVFRFWQVREAVVVGARGTRYRLRGWGGSQHDADDAGRAADARLDALTRKAAAGPLQDAVTYDYGTGVVREEWLQLLAGTEDAPEAVVTRNRYGAPVLNVRSLAIVDIDDPPPPRRALLSFWRAPPAAEHVALAPLRAWHAANPRACLRLYRTPKGWRVLRTDAPLPVESADAQSFLGALGADRLYVALCRRQQCYRARLGPKPWRAGLGLPPGHFPRGPEWTNIYDGWLRDYEAATAAHAACRFVETLGEDYVAEPLRALVAAHDAMSSALTDAPLA